MTWTVERLREALAAADAADAESSASAVVLGPATILVIDGARRRGLSVLRRRFRKEIDVRTLSADAARLLAEILAWWAILELGEGNHRAAVETLEGALRASGDAGLVGGIHYQLGLTHLFSAMRTDGRGRHYLQRGAAAVATLRRAQRHFALALGSGPMESGAQLGLTHLAMGILDKDARIGARVRRLRTACSALPAQLESSRDIAAVAAAAEQELASGSWLRRTLGHERMPLDVEGQLEPLVVEPLHGAASPSGRGLWWVLPPKQPLAG